MTFRDLGLNDSIVEAVEELGIKEPTKIQELSIPEIINGQDIIAGSATGSGKTLAFGTGIVQNLEHTKGIGALILAPTREIAHQVTDVIKSISYKLKVTSVYGGVAINPQMEALKTANIVVGTPGRILDHIQRETLDLSKVKMLVLDEADKMFDMGFIEDIERIMSNCPEERQTVLFSATYTIQIENLASRYMNNPKKIQGVKLVDPEKLKQIYYNVPVNLKFSLLAHLLKEEESVALVFANTKRMVDALVKSVRGLNIAAEGIHGDMSQAKRMEALNMFKDKKVKILICTDVAARGLDIPNVTHVYNYDIPIEAKDYVHRIGRTARAGKEGEVRNILAKPDFDNFSRVLRDHPKLEVTMEATPRIKKVDMSRIERSSYGRGHRPGNKPNFRNGKIGDRRTSNRPGGNRRAGAGTSRPK